MPTTKQQQLDMLHSKYINCMQCPLATQGRTQVVFGTGNANATLMLIGEGPGQQEDEQGEPFVGRSGKLLTRVLSELGINRKDIYITNIVKCRPPNNRKPLPLEGKTCKQHLLLKQINIIKPTVICTLGSAALEGLLEQPVRISQLRGRAIELGNLTIIPTYHPAYTLRNARELPRLSEDLKQAAQRAGLQIETKKMGGG